MCEVEEVKGDMCGKKLDPAIEILAMADTPDVDAYAALQEAPEEHI